MTGQLWSISTTTLQVRLRVQLNSILFAKTLVRKDVASSAASKPKDDDAPANATPEVDGEKKDEETEFSSKAQIMTLMTTDVDRVSEFSWHLFSLVGMSCQSIFHPFLLMNDFVLDAPIEIVIGSIFLYKLLGTSQCAEGRQIAERI